VSAGEYIQHYRELLHTRREMVRIFSDVDLILTPTSPMLPESIAKLEAAPEELRRKELVMLRNTRPFNVWGLPTVSIPCGFSKAGLPIGLQIAGAPGAEGTVLALALSYERKTEWHRKRPLPNAT
jgi:Asp-tRNA(Asn)/Glu-tRNA(Gln) amidotransferase A subunit family amidase